MNILFSINAKFIDLTKTCIQSILRFDQDVDFYILHHDLTKENQEDLESTFSSCHFHFIEVDETQFKDFPISSRYPLEIYYRLFASMLLPADIDRILYLDVDIIVISSLKKLYTMDFENNLYIASTHISETMTLMNAKRLGLQKVVPYINTGVLLMNLEALRNVVNKEEILDFVNTHKNKLVLFDQDVLTALYGDKTKIVEYTKYNLSERMMNFYNLRNPKDRIDLAWVRKNAAIIHYCGRMKPWKDKYIGCLDVFYKEVKEKSHL